MTNVPASSSKKSLYWKNASFWIAPLIALVLSLGGVLGFSIYKLFEATSPPTVGVFRAVMDGPPGHPSNVTGTLFENVVDKLSGDRVPVLLFQVESHYCGGPEHGDLKAVACVSRFTPSYIAFQEDLAYRMKAAYDDAKEKGLEDEAKELNQWESHIAAHEFSHILQYNYREETLPFMDAFDPKEIPAVELMAECYASLVYPMSSDSIMFHNFTAAEYFPKCTAKQNQATKDWLNTIGWTPEALAAN